MKKTKGKNIRSYSYSFIVEKEDDIRSRVIISRNNSEYCQFLDGSFLNPNGIGAKKMPLSEMVLLWKHMNYHDNSVVDHSLTLFCNKDVFTL